MASAISFGDGNAGFQAGTVNGPVNTTFQLPPQRQETPPPPSIIIPFARDADFVERGTTLVEVHQRCTAPNSRAALVGLGGVGKSQLAIEYAYRMRERSSETWVLWVHASNAARFEQSYRDIADRVKIVGRRDPQANIFKLVHDWLCDSKQRWLLVLDNVDDGSFLLEARASSKTAARPLREYLPHCELGSILITTRNKEAALKLVEQRDIIVLEPMSEAQALALLEKKLVPQTDCSNAAELAAVLEYMPLAIVQAAAYISQRAPLCSVTQYLNRFRKSESKRTSLLHRDDSQLRRDYEAKNSIITTWQISFEYIQQTRPSAADLLSLMSFFDRQGIPKSALRIPAELEEVESRQDDDEADAGSNEQADASQFELEDDSGDDSSEDSSVDNDSFHDDVAALRNFCFISVHTEGTSFEMHALVQLAMRTWLAGNGKLEHWKQAFISNLYAEFPTGEYENWAACQALFAHAKAAVSHKPEAASSLKKWAALLYLAAWYAERKGNASEAEILAMQSLKVQNALGRERQDTIRTVAMLADGYSLGGRWDEAEKLRRQVMETRKMRLGADHPETLISMANLASTYSNQGRWDEAEELQVQVMEMSKTKLGADHPDTLSSIANLALTYLKQGRWDEAEKLQVQVMEMSRTKLGADHPDTLTSTSHLASTYWNQGRWDEAEKLDVQVMETSKTKLGADHPDTITSTANLASTYSNQGRWDDAEKLEVQVMETRKTKLGVDHPTTLTSMANLALTYSNQGRWDDAEKLQVQVMETSKTKLGADHPSTLNSIANLALTYWNQGRWDDAEKLEVQVVEMSKTKLGVDHPNTLTSMANLALTYCNQGRWDDAEELQLQVMEMSKTKLGADHPNTLTSMGNLAFIWKRQSRDFEAINLMKSCIQLRQQIYTANHPDLESSLAVLAQWETEQVVAD